MQLESDIEINRAPTNINDLLESTCVLLTGAYESKQQNVKFEPHHSLPTLRADANLLANAFASVLKNSIRYTPDDGSITVRTSLDDAHVSVVIQDNGIGIDEAALSRIYERFYRVDEAHSTAGFGVGLSSAKKIVELHQGTISVESQPGVGSIFTIELPIVP